MLAQIKTIERVRKHGEVFTNPREVNAMLDLVSADASCIDSTFMEPACGNGNFLDEILRRKLVAVFRFASGNDADGEYLATKAFASIYGIDIQMDNVMEARNRLFDRFFAAFVNAYKHRPSQICSESIQFILSQNIQCGNTLTGTTTEGNPLLITQWFFDQGNGLTINIYNYNEMVTTGCNCLPVHSLPRIPYLLLPAIIQKDCK